MSKQKLSKVFSTRIFGLIIGAGVILVMLLLNLATAVPERLETRMLDLYFRMKTATTGQQQQEGVTTVQRNPQISPDLLIVGVDFSTLARFGNWPFPRYRHADLITRFARIRNQNQRERAVWLDIFFVEPSDDAYNDVALREAMEESGRVVLETALGFSEPPQASADELFSRMDTLYERHGVIRNIEGDWSALPYYLGTEPPLRPFGRESSGYGHANFNADFDEVFRRVPLIARSAQAVAEVSLSQLDTGFEVDSSSFQDLAWRDQEGRIHQVELPLTDARLQRLQQEMEARAPVRRIDTDNDGEIDQEQYILRVYQSEFVPAVALDLALTYFNKELSDIEVVIGEYIRIPEPQYFNTETGEWGPYIITERYPETDADGNVIREGRYREVPEITIPIDEYGEMLINFMGPRSSATRDGNQTYPVRPHWGYAFNVPGPDPGTWPPTLAVDNKIIMVGAFATGMAADEKNTPYGLMYGVEMHANVINTIVMDNFLLNVPYWVDLVVLIVLTLLIAFVASRLSTPLGAVLSVFAILATFVAAVMLFLGENLIMNFTQPALSVLITFVAIVIYRVMTEEKEKKRVQATFGKYVSPKVVEELLDKPPELGGTDKELTVFFSDIRGFTTLSEAMTPQELVNHLNVYLTKMTDIILEYEGTLDKYVGDEIMCFWGAPVPQEEHALLACKCAIKQMRALKELNEGWPEQKRIDIGIGVNSGIMTVGNMGSAGRMNYTLMGDNVNLGARLEGTNKQYMTNIIISEYTYGLVKDHVLARELDNIRVKGKNRPVLIYELLDVEDLDPPTQ